LAWLKITRMSGMNSVASGYCRVQGVAKSGKGGEAVASTGLESGDEVEWDPELARHIDRRGEVDRLLEHRVDFVNAGSGGDQSAAP
jgi:hypothetical protein